MNVQLPDHALPFFGPDKFNWDHARWVSENLKGMTYGGVAVIPAYLTTPNAIIFTSDLDVDLDGLGGSTLVDPCYENQTSLRTAAGASVDSRLFPGIVIDNALISLGARVSDFGFIEWNGKLAAFQIYDVGPTRKIGEASIYLHRKLGLIKPDQRDHFAALNAPDASDISTLIFPGSGPGHAIAASLIEPCARSFVKMPVTFS